MTFDLYLTTINHTRNKEIRIPLITPGLRNPGKNGVANDDTTLIMGIINMNKNNRSNCFNLASILRFHYVEHR